VGAPAKARVGVELGSAAISLKFWLFRLDQSRALSSPPPVIKTVIFRLQKPHIWFVTLLLEIAVSMLSAPLIPLLLVN